jgi:ABC-2 type transport system permease protein
VRTIVSLYIASLKEFLRDRMALFWTMAFPILFIVLFGLIFSGNNAPSYTVGLVNQDSGATGQAIAAAFGQVKAFTIKTGALDQQLDALRQGKLDLVIVIPAGLSDNVQAGLSTGVQVYYDQTKQTNGQIELSIVQQVLTGVNRQAFHTVPPPLILAPQGIVAHSLSDVDFLVPGILAMALMQLGIFGTAQPLVALREQQVLRRLSATPLPRWKLLVSQVLNRLTISVVQAALIVGIGAYAFKVQVANPAALAGLVLLGAAMFVSLGYLIASVARTQDSAGGISQAINFPMMFLSGIFFPIAVLPAFLLPVVRALPLTYLADAFRQVMVDSTPDFPITTDLLVVAGWVLACTVLSARLFRWE